jgi:hypothetical protein
MVHGKRSHFNDLQVESVAVEKIYMLLAQTISFILLYALVTRVSWFGISMALIGTTWVNFVMGKIDQRTVLLSNWE